MDSAEVENSPVLHTPSDGYHGDRTVENACTQITECQRRMADSQFPERFRQRPVIAGTVVADF